MKTKNYFLLLLILLLFTVSCTETSYPKLSQSVFYPDMYSSKPLTLLIMPVINRTHTTIDVDFILSANAIMLADRGYYVMPSSIIHNFIKQDSLECLPDVNPEPCRVFHDRFGVDALLFVAIKDWQKDFSSNTMNVEFEYSMVSSLTGRELWYYDILVTKNRDVVVPQPDNTDFWTSLCCGIFASVGSIFASTVATALTSYNVTAEEACQIAMKNLPAGKYHNRFMLDAQDQIKVNTIWKQQNFGNRLPVQ
jgi:hypothetical protein